MEKRVAILLLCMFVVLLAILQIVAFDLGTLSHFLYGLSWISSIVFAGTYDGKSLAESDASVSDLTDQQKEFLLHDNLRHVLITTAESAAESAQWNNNAQAYVEGLGLGIPINTSTDPRHAPSGDTEFNAGAGEIFQSGQSHLV